MSVQLTDLLRDKLHPVVDRLESTGLALRMITGDIDRSQYIDLMGQILLIHQRLETAIQSQPEVRQTPPAGFLRGATLQADLVQLNQGIQRTFRPLGATRWLLNQIDHWQHEQPPALLGALFVLESTRQWDNLLLKPLSEALGVDPLPGQGIDYHLELPGGHAMQWRNFEQRLNILPLDEATTSAICQAALDTLTALWQILDQVAERAAEDSATNRYAPKMVAAL